MKTVFNNSECVHTFAQRTQDKGRTSNNNIFFEGDKIYSFGYHYELGRFLDDKTILINDKGYSNSTAKHISLLIGATSQYRQYYKTKTDIHLVHTEIMYLKKKLSKARKPQMYISQIYVLWICLNEYINERNEKQLRKYKEYKELLKFVDSLQDETSIRDLRNWAKEESRKKKDKEKKQLTESLAKFRAYESNYFRIGGKDYLRLSKCAQFVETSQGVKIDAEEAKRYLKLLKSGAIMRGAKIGNYTTISFDKLLRIGCHNISKEEIQYINELI
jgi:hypothetical protein